MSIEEIARKFEVTAAAIERMFRWQVAIIGMTAAGVLWGARLEWNQAQLAALVLKHDARLDKTGEQISELTTGQALLKQRVGIAISKVPTSTEALATIPQQ